MESDFAGLVAVVTGGAAGIGAAVAARLLAGGASIAILDVDTSGAGLGTYPIVTDISDSTSVQRAIDDVIERFGRLDIVVNNAGIGARGTIEDNPDDEWASVFDVNVTGIARVSRRALPHLRRSPAAAIVNVSSIAATAGLPQRALYSASKGAVLALTRAMAVDHLIDGVRVNCVNPGTVNTAWVQRLLDASEDPMAERVALEARQPHGRLVEPEEIAEAVAYLANPKNSSTTGTSLAVDGGMQNLRPPTTITKRQQWNATAAS